MSVLLEAKNLSKHYPVKTGMFGQLATIKALNDVSFTLAKKQTLSIVGESGSGKSTLGRLLVKSEQPTSGQLFLHNEDVTKAEGLAQQKVQQRVRMIFQNPFSSLNPRWRIFNILEEPLLLNTTLTKPERKKLIFGLLNKVGLRPEHANRYPHMFSGGQRQRIAIARALILKPDIIVADEAVSALDVSIQAQILNLLQSIQDEMDVSYVFISHDLGVVRHISDQVLVMYFGYCVEYGDSEVVFSAPKHPYSKFLLSSTPQLHKKDTDDKMYLSGELPSPLNPPSGCPFHTRCPLAKDRCKTERPELRNVDGRLTACHYAEDV